MGQFSTEIYIPPGSTLSGNQHQHLSPTKVGGRVDLAKHGAASLQAMTSLVTGADFSVVGRAGWNFITRRQTNE
jgi:hypothetical protein